MDDYRIDSHKLMFHVPRVAKWLDGDIIYPIYVEMSPSGHCNHRCTFCALDYMGYQKRFPDTETLCLRLTEMARLGVKSVMFGGEGEPLLNPDIATIVLAAKTANLDLALTTNGVMLKKELSERILDRLEWIKVSINAGSDQTYAKIHQTKASDFNRVLTNLSAAAELRAQKNYNCTLGMQILLLPENRSEIIQLGRLARDIGMDYLVVKPYSHHPSSQTNRYKDVSYGNLDELEEALSELNNDGFVGILRQNAIQKWDTQMRTYAHCSALPFWAYIDAGGLVWGCSCYLGDERFLYGDLIKESFETIWQSKRRQDHLVTMMGNFDISECRYNCRMDEINKYLWSLKHPPGHVNFI